jgi:hypothetical protein
MASAFSRTLAARAADSSAEYDCVREAFGLRVSDAALSWAVAPEDNTDKTSRVVTVMIRTEALLQERM